jgi:hypothetical protein
MDRGRAMAASSVHILMHFPPSDFKRGLPLNTGIATGETISFL